MDTGLCRTVPASIGHRVVDLDFPTRFEGGISWPACSPDLNPCDFFLWGCLKEKVWRSNAKTTPELKTAIKNAFGEISTHTLKAVTSGFSNRLTAVIAKEGGHFEQLYH